MPASGSDVLRDLQVALDDARSQAARLRTEWQKLDGRMDELVARRGEAVLELAQFYLPDLSRESISHTLTGIQGELQALLERKDRRVDELSDRLDRLDVEREQTEHDLEVVTSRLNEKVRQRDELQQTVAAALAENVEFQSLSRQALAAEAELHRMEERVGEITRDAAEKLPAYEENRLFRYLYRRGFGTEAYCYRGLTRRLDRWVAQLVDFYPARKSYAFLKRTPELMREELDRYRQDFNELMSQVEELERFAADEAGLTRVMQEGQTLGAERDALVGKVDGHKAQCRQVEEELLALQQSQGQFYEQALARLRTFLAATETAVLEHHARQTPEPSDDEIVGRIAWLNQELDVLEPGVTSLSKDCEVLEQQSAGLDFVLRRYQQSNFDSQRSYFEDGFDPRESIERFRKGVTSKDDLWQSIRQRQRFEPTWVEQSAADAGQALNSPLAHVLMHAMVEVAGAAMTQAAQRSVQRRSQMGRGGTGHRIDVPMPQSERTSIARPAPSAPSPPSPPPMRERGFTSGEGF